MLHDANGSQVERIFAGEMKSRFLSILLKYGMSAEKAESCASVFTDNSLDGVYTHGVNRFARFVQYIQDRLVLPEEEPVLISAYGAIEQWNGRQGPGPTNAITATNRAVNLASAHGIGCVALANTNHWMRGGLYGWKAARQGCMFIGWTNTIANMPAWGAVDAKLGNNPLVLALPFGEEAIVLDMAMSQFSFGALEQYAMQKQQLPIHGGYDGQGNLTTDPAAILTSRRVLPVGYWKGAGLALLLDIFATILSAGFSTSTITRNGEETSVSQVFICIDPSKLSNAPGIATAVAEILNDYQQSTTRTDKVTYPGQRVIRVRSENSQNGIPVNAEVWAKILQL